MKAWFLEMLVRHQEEERIKWSAAEFHEINQLNP